MAANNCSHGRDSAMGNGDYQDMIHLDRPISRKYIPMSMEHRAAQFSPFAALTGYEEAIENTARLAEEQIREQEQLGEDE